MSDKKTEETTPKISKKKKIILTFVVGAIAIVGIAYKRHLDILNEAAYYNMTASNLEKVKENLKQERF
ncbi:MAG: hypothetical protein JKY63_04765 [Rhodobiaceae bacterium]|nr:hypothetical protein [Alphaproteobacteria bacterium]MBL4864188.1 hypothetical protein [Rhodobiaceae bacterium]